MFGILLAITCALGSLPTRTDPPALYTAGTASSTWVGGCYKVHIGISSNIRAMSMFAAPYQVSNYVEIAKVGMHEIFQIEDVTGWSSNHLKVNYRGLVGYMWLSKHATKGFGAHGLGYATYVKCSEQSYVPFKVGLKRPGTTVLADPSKCYDRANTLALTSYCGSGSDCTGNPPAPANGVQTTCASATTTHGTSCGTVTCNAHFTPSVPTNVWCNNGAWVSPTCDADPCIGAPPAVSNGQPGGSSACTSGSSTQSFSSGSTCPLTCSTGYTSSGNYVCALSTWSAPTCSATPCTGQPTAPANAVAPSCPQTASGGSCAFQCATGYEASSGAYQCNLGQWSSTGLTCSPKPCGIDGLYSPVGGRSVGTSSEPCTTGASTPNGGICTLTCNRGCTKSSDFVCTLGSWNSPACACAGLSPASLTESTFSETRTTKRGAANEAELADDAPQGSSTPVGLIVGVVGGVVGVALVAGLVVVGVRRSRRSTPSSTGAQATELLDTQEEVL